MWSSMDIDADTSKAMNSALSEPERKQLAQEESRNELSKQDAIMEPTTASYVDQYLKAGVAPFNIMNLLMSSYEGLAAMANMVAHDILGAYGADEKIAILETLNSKIVENFDCQSADREFETTHQLPEYIGAMLPHQFWRKTIYRLSERYPKSTMLSASIQYIADQGFQAEMTSLNSASLHTHVFYSLLAECFEKVAPADDDVIKERLRELVQLVCRREQTYVVAQYVLRNVRQRVGVGAAALARIEDELEAEMLEKYGRPQLVVNIRLLLEGFVVGGNDSVANAVASIIQSGHAAPGDVVSLYKQYYAAHTDKSRDPASKPPVHVLRSDRVMLPIIEQAFGHLWNSTQFNEREELMAKYIWLIAYGTLCTCDSTHMDVVDDTAISQLVAQLKEVRTGLPTSPTQTLLNSVVLKVLEWISVPIISRIVLLWMREVISYSNFTFYQMYYRSSEPPVPLLLLEEIAYRHPLQKPKVFETYCESFESKVPDFPAEKQIKLQKAVINRMAVLVQLDYSAPVLRYFDSKSEYMDESIVVYFIQRTLAQFEPPYPPEFAKPMIKLIMRAWNGIKVADEKERVHVRAFLAALESTDDVARRLLASLPEPVSPVAEL